MRPRDEAEAAYFALLRAREDLDALRRHADYLADEVRRLRRFAAETAAHADTTDRRLRRAIAHTDAVLEEALRHRTAAIDYELQRMPRRIEGAEAYLEACEVHHRELQAG